ncbi:hypothetical protein FOL46_003907 [Perkinsus olseni]|uniref:phosphoglycerate mutase (2,3-diphosphoglycerate-dependent) n=1 Tax=Perkinsus olseni TaxID=32597 RepID=A0A7J6M0F5_PEROL|nr:hypothetical protein FOL46_003907 [Perkinsus olseni]
MASWRLAYKNMPVDLILVRHGESEGNLAQKMAQQGDVPNPWTSGFRARHNSKYRLTDRGRAQAEAAGEWIKDNVGEAFDICLTSEYIRAMETAAYLHVQEAEWRTEFFLRERDRGVLANKSKMERRREHADEIERQDRDSFYFQPSGGESIANLCLRVESVIKHLQKGSAGLRVIIVCHGGVIKAFRALVERKRQTDFSEGFEVHRSSRSRSRQRRLHPHEPTFKIYNGMVVHYSRRDPTTGLISDNYHWVRCACPWRPSLVNEEWIHFAPHVLTNDMLLAEVQKVPQLVNEGFDVPSGRYPHEEPSSPTSDYAETVTERPSRSSLRVPGYKPQASEGDDENLTIDIGSDVDTEDFRARSLDMSPTDRVNPESPTDYDQRQSSIFSLNSQSSSVMAPQLRTSMSSSAGQRSLGDSFGGTTLDDKPEPVASLLKGHSGSGSGHLRKARLDLGRLKRVGESGGSEDDSGVDAAAVDSGARRYHL